MKTCGLLLAAAILLALIAPGAQPAGTDDVPLRQGSPAIDPDLVPYGDDLPTPFELSFLLGLADAECREKCRPLLVAYWDAFKRDQVASDAWDADEERRRIIKSRIIEIAGVLGYSEEGKALRSELRDVEARLPQREKEALEAERAAVRAERRFRACIDKCLPPEDRPSTDEGDPVLHVLERGRPAAVQAFYYFDEAKAASPNGTISGEALSLVPQPARRMDLGPTDAAGLLKIPLSLGFGIPGTTAVLESCEGYRSLYAFAPKVAPSAKEARRLAESQAEADRKDCTFRPATFQVDVIELPGSFNYTRALWAGIPAVAGGAVVATRGGSGRSTSMPTTPTSPGPSTVPSSPSTPSTPPSTAPSAQGRYVVSWRVLEDLRQSAAFVQFQSVPELRIAVNSAQSQSATELRVQVDGEAVTITGPAPLPVLMGTLTSGRIVATGAGPIAGRSQVGVTFTGTLAATGGAAAALDATVTVGEDGTLGPPLPHRVVYGLTGTQRP